MSHAFSNAPPFAINVAFRVKPERKEDFIRVMQNNLRRTLDSEPNALQFVLGQDVDDVNAFYLHEEYKTRADHVDPHSKSSHYAECMAFFDTAPFIAPPVADEFALLHDGPREKIQNSAAVCLNVELRINPAAREEFLGVIRQNKAGSDAEPLCRQYSWGESVRERNVFHFHEQYAGEAGLAAHNTAEHFAVWEKFAEKEGVFARPPVVQKYRVLLGGEANE